MDCHRLDSHRNGDCAVYWTGLDDALETGAKCPTEKVCISMSIHGYIRAMCVYNIRRVGDVDYFGCLWNVIGLD